MVLWHGEEVLMFRGYLRISLEIEIQYSNSSDSINTIFEYSHASVNFDHVDVDIM